MKQYIIQLASLLLIISFLSCDDYLGKAPKDTITMQKIKDYESLLNYSQANKTMGVYNCFFTDDVFFPDKDPGGQALNQATAIIQNFYTFQERLYPSGDNDWTDCYKSISVHNTILEKIMTAIDGTQKQKKSIYAESLLARAFEFSQLLTLYAKAYNPETAANDAGIPLIVESDITQTNLTRASIKEVYEKIISDVEEAIPSLPDTPSRNVNAFRGSKVAAWAFLARIYLQQKNYEKALDYAEKAIEAQPAILNLNNCKLTNPNVTSGRNDVPIRDLNPESVYIRFCSFVNTMSGRAYVEPDLINLFNKDTDRRFKLFMTDKYKNIQREYYIWAPGFDANIGIATPEVYLIAAECHARLNNIPKAMEYLEALRENRYENYTAIPTTGLTKNGAIKLILEERRRELMMIPGIRLADIKRLAYDPDFKQTVKRTINGKTTIVQPTSNLLLIPIPDIVMEFNPDMEQNIRKD
ncbi:RagB/SusD family nutrient uptake outer membrane protein [Dysgonomonas sp. Marseille-P4677]|uniref:RagB/SusD family nutrient uptake outer membrane protein n=1 Tax=Dysgonomonas sp. Marseille-P4677 TaxID=2364790 RepID=UPI0019135688|nr:RagB/SusD family nutrient uptake outer membrane protein [Dysgonomonas sp. Marseille-P4677]MBK5722349.1 RagB/SusD family nutrient uptake outer membrane protein [Dysgonomonas sp. Marseille-P4677]